MFHGMTSEQLTARMSQLEMLIRDRGWPGALAANIMTAARAALGCRAPVAS